ncbi:unnamed protein product [Ectocarpus sp. CCAP 1310/34]|nr:unnamed protein product [Ectocarpus sp. CCAP 1310/34]
MDVHVGYFPDPDDLPGLAHFCENLLFLGTDKYPDESRQAHLKSHGGSSNAYTASDDTVYYFNVASDHLAGPDGALDRFAQFFIAPQFTESATEREPNAIESENAKDLTCDYWRLLRIENSRITACAGEPVVYYFNVASDHLAGPDGALDRFAQFFIAPQVGGVGDPAVLDGGNVLMVFVPLVI